LNTIQPLAISGNYLFVPGPVNNMLAVVDISNPASMSVATTIPIANGCCGIVIRGNYAYVVTGSGNGNVDTLSVVDISTPTSPTVVGSVTDSRLTFGSGLDISGTNLYIALINSPGAVTVVNVSDPTNPLVVTSFTDPTLDTTETAAISGNYAYVTSGFLGSGANTLDVLDIRELH
jgi:hypothetical protein